MFRILAASAVFAVSFGVSTTTAMASGCHEIKFAYGAYHGEVSGQVSYGHPTCYTFHSGNYQTATVELWSEGHVCFSLPGLHGCHKHYTFQTKQGQYRLDVQQAQQGYGPDSYSLKLTIH